VRRGIWIFLLLMFLLGSLFGVTRRISYQGRVTNASGVGLNGTYDVVFKAYNDPLHGTRLDMVTVTMS
jgi:hypothetical protein